MKPEILIKEGKIYLAIEGQKYVSVASTEKAACRRCVLNDTKLGCILNKSFNPLKKFNLQIGEEILKFIKDGMITSALRSNGSYIHFSCTNLGFLAGGVRSFRFDTDD